MQAHSNKTGDKREKHHGLVLAPLIPSTAATATTPRRTGWEKHGIRLAPLPDAAEQLIREPYDARAHTFAPVPTMLGALNGVVEDATLVIELERKEAHELLGSGLRAAGDASSHVAQKLGGQGGRFGNPAHDQHVLERAGAERGEGQGSRLQADGLDLEADVAYYGEAVPGERGGPQGGFVGGLAVRDGEVGVGRGEEVEGDVVGEDFGGEGLLEYRGEALFEDSYG